MKLADRYQYTRSLTLAIVRGLSTELLTTQTAEFTSPPKWHLAHTSWFFERLFLIKHHGDYQFFDSRFDFLFNSYYQALGKPIPPKSRGQITSPSWEEVLDYRRDVDQAVQNFLSDRLSVEKREIIELGLQHEMQHQELLLSDLKYNLGQQPYKEALPNYSVPPSSSSSSRWLTFKSQLTQLGHEGRGFGFDNEKPRHKIYLQDYAIRQNLVSNAEWLEFIEGGAYQDFQYWHEVGWEWVRTNQIEAPLYWFKKNQAFWGYSLDGFKPIDPERPVAHISYFEAYAFAQWKGLRLPTEAEWEHAANQLQWGDRWEWTESAYLPYPGFQSYNAEAAEYNAKFMVNQLVLKGAFIFTPQAQIRKTYRNFLHAHDRWQCSGLRLAK